jgi:hypothetical protein
MSKHRQEPPRHAGNKPGGARRATNKPEEPPPATAPSPTPIPAPRPVPAKPVAAQPAKLKPARQAAPPKPPKPRATKAPKPARVSSATNARYGKQAGSGLFLIIGGVIGAVFLVWLVWAVWLHSTPDVRAALTSYEFDDHLAIAQVDVEIDKGVIADCTVQAIAEDHSIVGVQHFSPVNGSNTVPFRIDRPGTSVTLVGCTVLDSSGN